MSNARAAASHATTAILLSTSLAVSLAPAQPDPTAAPAGSRNADNPDTPFPLEKLEFVRSETERGFTPNTPVPDGLVVGFAAADFDADGDIDVFIPNDRGVPDQLFRNLGDGAFEEVAAQLGLASTERNRMALWFDYDNDADLDLLIGRDNFLEPDSTDLGLLRLFEQGPDGTFTDVTAAAGLDVFVGLESSPYTGYNHLSCLTAIDIDNDDDLDLFVPMWHGRTYLIENQGGVFVDVTDTNFPYDPDKHYWQVVALDYDNDGWQDMFAAIDDNQTFFYHNQQDGTFIENNLGAPGEHTHYHMGVAAADIDNDSDIDVFVTNTKFHIKNHPIWGALHRRNHLYLNDSTPGAFAFADVGIAAGVDDGAWGWGPSILDANLDGWPDIAHSNGYFHSDWLTDRSRFFLNSGQIPLWFDEVGAEVGFDSTEYTTTTLSADLDRDGDLELLELSKDGPLRVYDNRFIENGTARHHVCVRPRSAGPNHFSIGAVVSLSAGGLTQTRGIFAGQSMAGQEPAEAHFGLGESDTIDELTIRWADGRTVTLMGVPADQTLTITPAAGADSDLNLDGRVDSADVLLMFGAYADGRPGADRNADGVVDAADLRAFLLGASRR